MRHFLIAGTFLLLLSIFGCPGKKNPSSPSNNPTSTHTSTATPQDTATASATATVTPTRTLTGTPTLSPTATPTSTTVPTIFRITTMVLRDPHGFANPGICLDITDITSPVQGFNSLLQSSIQIDGNSDGLLDMSNLLIFRPLNQNGTGTLELRTGANCTSPLVSTSCSPGSSSSYSYTYFTESTNQCLTYVPGTVRPYSPAITSPSGPCFYTGPLNVTFNLGGIPFQLSSVYFGGTFFGNPATEIRNGLMFGFLRETDANSTILPISFPVVGGQPFSSLLRGGLGCCSQPSPAAGDKDLGTDGTTSGWWFYFNYTALLVPYSGP